MTANTIESSDPRSDFLPTRSSLLERVKNLDNDAGWEEFFDTYQRSIHGLAIKCGLTRSEAEEVVQETMVAVSKKMPSFEYDRSIGSFKGWLFTITRCAVSNQFAKRHLKDKCDGAYDTDQLAEMPDTAGSFDETWEEDWRHNLLDLAVDRVRRRIKPKQFQMFDLYVNHQLPMDQVTRILNVNAAQVYMAKLRVSSAVRHEVSLLEKKLV